MCRYWLSFVDPDRPDGERFLGVCIVDIDRGREMDRATIARATSTAAWRAGCNPGGEVLVTELEDAPIPPSAMHRLLTRQEAAAIDRDAARRRDQAG